jgi:hypothetical protein
VVRIGGGDRGIVSLETGGCPEDCHFCSQSGRFRHAGPGGKARHPLAGGRGAPDGADRRGGVLHRRGRPRSRRAPDGGGARRRASNPPGGGLNVACSLGILTRAQADELAALGVHRYNHNLETARSYSPEVVTMHTWEERWETSVLAGGRSAISTPSSLQLPNDARPRSGGGPRAVGRSRHAGQGALRDVMTSNEHCDGCGKPLASGDHRQCRARRAATDPPRFCVACGRKLVVQGLPLEWKARCVSCGPVAST